VDLARALNISKQRLSALRTSDAPEVSAVFCLRLALVARLPPTKVLRAAGKGDVAQLLDDLYAHEPLEMPGLLSEYTPAERHAVESLRRLSSRERTVMCGLLRKMADANQLMTLPDAVAARFGIPDDAPVPKRAIRARRRTPGHAFASAGTADTSDIR